MGKERRWVAPPLEITFMLRDFLGGKGLLDKTEITYTYPIGRLHTLEPVAGWASPEFNRFGIKNAVCAACAATPAAR